MFRQAILISGLLWAATAPAVAAGSPDTTIQITLGGQEDSPRQITVAEVESAGLQQVNAYNPYDKNTDAYTGVWMKDFVAKFGSAETTSMTVRAIDDYEIDFDKSEWQTMRILIATRVDGAYIDFDKKGPMRIIFPDFDETLEEYQTKLPKWIWMITEISME